jgi:hypothetical protein
MDGIYYIALAAHARTSQHIQLSACSFAGAMLQGAFARLLLLAGCVPACLASRGSLIIPFHPASQGDATHSLIQHDQPACVPLTACRRACP